MTPVHAIIYVIIFWLLTCPVGQVSLSYNLSEEQFFKILPVRDGRTKLKDEPCLLA